MPALTASIQRKPTRDGRDADKTERDAEMQWTNDELTSALGKYEEELVEAGLQPVSVDSFVGYSRRFLRWRVGDYRPRSAVGPGRQPTRGPVDVNGLDADLIAYELELRTARLQPLAVQTYVDQAARFIRWLDGLYTPRNRARPGSARRDRNTRIPSTTIPVSQGTRSIQPANRPPTMAPRHDGSTTPDAIILGCVATKHPGPAKAKDLYASPMFAKRRRYAESTRKPWVIFSAEHGILDPDDVIEWYDVALSKLPVAARRAKGAQAAAQLEARFGSLRGKTFEIHAGSSYVKSLEAPLRARGARLVNPLARLQFGYQLQWYDDQAGGKSPETARPATSPPRRPPTTPRPPVRTDFIDPTDLTVGAITELGPFDLRWPENIERFDHGWEFTAQTGGATFPGEARGRRSGT
jgi:hypothetical protein